MIQQKSTRSTKTIKTRRWTAEDIPALVACQKAAYPSERDQEDERTFRLQLEAFPEGQFLAEINGEVVGYGSSLIVQLNDDEEAYTYDEITGDGTFRTHLSSGDTLFEADTVAHPDARARNGRASVAAALHKERRRLLKRYNLRRIVAYELLDGYAEYAGQLTAREYVDKVVLEEIEDPVLSEHLRAGYAPRRVLLDLRGNGASLNPAVLLEMPNLDFRPERRKIAAAALRRPVRKVRVCAAQYQMRHVATWAEFERGVEFFVNTADTYDCHFLVLPELFTVQLLSTMPRDIAPQDAALRLAEQTDRYVEMFRRFASERQLYIIGGSTPTLRDGVLYNVAHLFSPSGNVYTQDKLHVTPFERELWGVRPGQGIKIFETPLARIAIQICYDIEFPEVARALTLAGVEAIFVPFSTDEKKAFQRVRITSQARAVENYIYTVIAGNVGNFPTSKAYLINYGQAAVFTPSDFSFAPQATLAEADPNVEAVAIAELDLTSLAQQRDLGSVRPLYDRRPDLYEVRTKEPVQVVRVE